jgi:hypothetical protein
VKAHNKWSPSPTRGNLPWSSTRLRHLPPSFFSLYLLPVHVLIFTHLFFVLVLHLLPLSLAPGRYVLFSPVYPGSARGIFTMLQHWDTASPSYCCVLDYHLLIKYFLSVLPLHLCEDSPVSRYHTG